MDTPPTALPNDLPRPPDELARLEAAWRPPRGWRIVSSVNNSHVGLFYIATALVFFVAAGALALVMRAQLALPGNTLVSPALYAQLFTMHGTVMMFLFAVPVVEAVAVYLLPGMLGARDLPFPRLSAYAFWAYAIGATVFFATLFFGAAPDGGWFLYPPLSNKVHSPGIGADWWLLGIGFIEISAIAGAVELVVGILATRAPGMTLARMPVYAWAMLVVAAMIVFAFPALIAATALLELERAFDWPFFDPARGGDPLLWQHLFWFFGHPEVYIIFLPAAGLVSMLVPVLARTPLVGERAVVAALAAVGVLSFALWMHHMFAAGIGALAALLTSLASLAVAVPSVLQVFAWIATLGRGSLRWCASLWFVAGFLALFVLGGLTGVMVALLPFDRHAHDSHFVVAHLHYVLVGGLVFPLFAALYHWLPLVAGHALDERLGRWAFALLFVGFNVGFGPMHASGLLGMPRRVHTYPSDPGWLGLDALNAVSTLGAFVFAAGVALVAFDLVRTLRRPARRDHGDPWQAATLEWLPTGSYGVRSMPRVTSARPLWSEPGLAAQVEAGAHYLPGNPTGGREALVTSWRGARPRYLLVLPGDGWLPLAAAAGTAGFFLLLTVGWVVAAWASGGVAVACIVAWLWGLDRDAPIAAAPIARDLVVPVGGDGRPGHVAAALAVVAAVDASLFASFVWAQVHVALAGDVCPPPGAALPAGGAAAAPPLAWLLGALAAEMAGRRVRAGDAAPGWIAAAALGAALAAGADLGAQAQAQLAPARDAWSAGVAVLVGYGVLHALLAALVAAFAFARAQAGLLRPQRRAALDTLRVLLWMGGVQALVAAFALRATLGGTA